MKKTFYIIALGLLGLVGFTQADTTGLNVTPTTQTAISGSLVTFTVTGINETGDAYIKYVLPKTAAYDIVYQNASLTPLNNALLSIGIEHDPVFYIPANSNFSVTVTAKTTTTNRSLPTIDPICNVPANVLACSLGLNTCPSQCTNVPIVWIHTASDMQFSTLLHSLMSWITPVSELTVTNVLTGMNPSFSGDIVSYSITLKNIGSTSATGISFISNFPIPTLGLPTATFNGIPHAYNYINYPQDFVWTGSYLNNLNPGQTITILLNAPITQSFAVGTTFNQIAKTTSISAEYSTGNNSATATGIVQATPDVRVTKTLAPFTGFNIGDQVIYTITYGNSGGKQASNVSIIDTMSGQITLPTTNFAIGTLPAGSGGTITLTGTFSNLLSSGYVFVNTAKINTTSIEASTGNNTSLATGTVQGLANVSINIIANNISNPALDNVPYGSGPSVLIQAVSGNIVQLTITYTNFGNVPATNAVIGISGTQGFVTLGTYNGNIGTLLLNTTGTLVVTGIVGPKNFISFVPTARLSYNSGALLTDNVTVQEPLVCGDGILTRTETCDIQGNLGVLYSGQVCENQQGMCVLVTQSIINNACMNYQYNNPLGGITTGQSCSSVTTALSNASCATMSGSTPVPTSAGYSTNFTCNASNGSATTPISIDCGNGTIISGTGTTFNGTCTYATGFVGSNAQCRVGNDVNNAACRVPVTANQMQCDLEALDGRIVIMDSNDGQGEGRFRCETRNSTTAQNIRIDCGAGGISDQGGQYADATNTSQIETVCHYDENVNSLPITKNVQCYVNSAVCENENITLDQGLFGRCGDNVRQGYEDCDGTDTPEGMTCTANCDIASVLPVGCFNVSNANLSVQEDEYLPFWRKVDAQTRTVTTCNASNQDKVRADSLDCSFSISNKDGIAKTINTVNCKNTNTAKIFNYFNTAGAYGKFTELVDNDLTQGIYGEYKVALDSVDYEYCGQDGNGNRTFLKGTPINRVCETNFTVTKPYLIQKSSFGLTPKTTTDLSIKDFYGFDQQAIVTSTQLDKIMVINADTYKGGSSVSTMMDKFITKYSKLAVKYTTIKSKEQNTITVSKVPGQDIIVFKGIGTITYTDGGAKTKPFTVIVDGPSIEINGTIEKTNAMFLLNKGNITFLPSADACTKTQVVKGIFVTNKGLFSAGTTSLKNNSINEEWCAYGGLDVQGILIGNGIESIVQSRRSQLNHWFTIGNGITSDTAIQTERRNEIFKGAAVLIEYSPSLWSALPPGASEFTKALDVYKQ